MTSSEHERIRRLERETRELREANAILREAPLNPRFHRDHAIPTSDGTRTEAAKNRSRLTGLVQELVAVSV